MSLVLRIVLIIITLIYLMYLVKSVKQKKLQVSFSTFWIISAIILIIAVAIPNLIEWVSAKLGFETPSNMVFFATIFIAFCLIFNLTVKLSQEHKKNVTLVQEISMLKKRVEKIEKNSNKSDKESK